MKRLALSVACMAAVIFLGLATANKAAADPGNLFNTVVSFGAGQNDVAPIDHRIIPDSIKVKAGGVVHFIVAGFHNPVVYKPAVTLAEVQANVPASGAFVNYFPVNEVLYQGPTPTAAVTSTTDIVGNQSIARNRIESVSFAEPGTYLVICNVRGHFNDGMYAYVEVLP